MQANEEHAAGGASVDAAAAHATGADEGGISLRTMELIVALLLLAAAIVVIWSNQAIGAGWGPDGPESGYFPLRVGAIVLVCSVAVAWQAWRTPRGPIFATWQQLRQVSVILLPLTIYVGLIGFLGIYVASALFLCGFMIAVGKTQWWRAALLAVGISVVLFWIFEVQFRVPLPKGPLEAAFGY
ncbi:tripartite tricarboxylate transporter TctB family protein [Cupriavidus sp. AU9028]|uniref:tripartite tricarboxylate transporter TctB family protein n=1 Tax=Cupriavidus sp. AU9028 TaxID=2871157 RepID=UPI001C9653E4|nr:tripartite tricarboxylate transporter TctB family protein [Cupriavidus sp. AU9028]MBY4895667.1 tripartite tricarboxylate transporter TctB family protein [Cupriavidus sp. AU9028]